MSWYKIAQHGEWWVIGNQAVYADSNTGEMGHEAYVIESVRGEIADEMYSPIYDEYYEWDEVKQNIVKNLDASVGLYNLLDEQYGNPGFSEHRQDVLNQDGINFRVKLTYRF